MTTIVCKDCNKSFSYEPRRGRPAVRCDTCKEKLLGVQPSTSVREEVAGGETMGELDAVEDKQPEKALPVIAPLGAFTYEVIVTNLGFAYRGEDMEAAKKSYNHFRSASEAGYGQVGRERVTLYEKAEIVWQFNPATDMV